MTFRATKVVTDDVAEVVLEMRDSEAVKRILAEAVEYSEDTPPASEPFVEAPAAPARPKASPVQEEILEEDEEEEEEEEAPPPPPPKAKKKKAQEEPTKAPKDDFDAMLDSILN